MAAWLPRAPSDASSQTDTLTDLLAEVCGGHCGPPCAWPRFSPRRLPSSFPTGGQQKSHRWPSDLPGLTIVLVTDAVTSDASRYDRGAEALPTRRDRIKPAGEIMEILEAYDLVGTHRGAAELPGCDHHTLRK
jgi:hypothetical protein